MPKLNRFKISVRLLDGDGNITEKVLEENETVKAVRYYLVKYQSKWIPVDKINRARTPLVIAASTKLISDLKEDANDCLLVVQRLD